LRSIADGDTWPTSRIGRETRSRGWSRRGSAVGEAFGSMPSAMTARLIGALELTVSELEFAAVPDLSGVAG
jgi:hypothetical protein